MGNQQLSISEIFLQHPTYPQLEVSDLGSIRSSVTKKPRYLLENAQGYLVVQVREGGKRKTLKVHRLVAETFLPKPDEHLTEKCSTEHWGEVIVKHLDNDKLNNTVSNLAWSDLKGNTRQAWDDGLITAKLGEDNGRATLTETQVHALCLDFEAGMQPKEAAVKHKVSRQQASKIRAGIQWKHVWRQYKITVNRRDKSSTTSRKA